MHQENVLKRRCRKKLYSIYSNYLGEDKKKKFDEIRESDPYLNQIVEDVIHYVIYDLPLDEIILDTIHGEYHAGS